MPVVTCGDVLDQCYVIGGGTPTDANVIAAYLAGLNTAYARVWSYAQAEGFTWAQRQGVGLAVSAAADNVILPDGTTVLDTTAAIPPRCVSVVGVALDSTARLLARMPKDRYEVSYGSLLGSTRGTPLYFDPYGWNAARQQILWLMPLSADADVVYLDYVAGYTPLSTRAQELLVPVDERELVAQLSIQHVNARDTIDEAIVRMSMIATEELWRGLNARAAQYKARHPMVY